MPKLTFRGARITSFTGKPEESDVIFRAHIEADYSDRIATALGWPESMPDGIDSAKLEGELTLRNFILTPNGGQELKRFEIDVAARDAQNFICVRTKASGESSMRQYLRFIVRIGGVDEAAKVLAYMGAIGQGVGAMKMDCEFQQPLDFASDAEEKEEVDDDEPPLTGEALREHQTLASVAEMRRKGAVQ